MDQLSGNTTEHPNGFVHHDWIKFDQDYIRYWTDCELDWYEKHKKDAYRGWAMGHVYETNYFPQSLAGTKVRSPGRYHRTFYENGKPDMKHLLQDTNESILPQYVRASISQVAKLSTIGTTSFPTASISHRLLHISSAGSQVRAHHRTGHSGKGGPLHGWKLDDGHESHRDPNMEIDMSPEGMKEVTWKYGGDEPCETRVLPEDKLGPFELKLLEKDQNFADKIMFSNNAWQWFKKRRPKASPRISHTF